MHTNYYFLRQLAPALATRLTGLKLMACYSQDRDELVLIFAQARGKANYYRPFFVKATLRPDFSGLLFPEAVQRARTNSIDLFETLTAGGEGRNVVGVRSFLNERCLAILLENDGALLFKFFGNRPNLLAFEGNRVTALFNQKLVADGALQLDQLDRPIDQSWAAFERAGFDHRQLFPTFGKEVNRYLAEHGLTTLPEGEHKWALLQDVVAQLENPTAYYLTRLDHRPALTLLPMGDADAEPRRFTEPIEAANRFYIAVSGLTVFEREKADALRLIEKRQKRAQALIDAGLQRLISRDDGPTNEERGHILMANLHQIPEVPGQRSPERIELYDFYRDQPVTIKLKPDLTPQRNAETYYRKAKNEKIEEEHLQQQISQYEAELPRLAEHHAAVAATTSLKELRRYVKQHNLLTERSDGGASAELFKTVVHEGFTILIGRNAKNNDLLTQRYAYKDDLWLHARDVSGSHVVVKYQAGKRFPKTVIERAAELAAWYSKRRTDSLCPVMVTPKKFVRKPKGLAEGQVVVDKEDVVMVVPRGEK